MVARWPRELNGPPLVPSRQLGSRLGTGEKSGQGLEGLAEG